jgi:hypothetical protein
MLKRRYDQEGINLRQAQLLKSFWHQCKFINYFEINKLILSLSHSINSILIIYWLKYILTSVIKFYQPLANLQLIKNIALFSHLLMMREIEIVYWAALNTEEDIQILINQCIKDKG